MSEKKTIWYSLDGDDYRFEHDTSIGWIVHNAVEFVAQDCAEDFFHNHDGWESSWPRTISVYDTDEEDAKLLGKYLVNMETEPRFYAREEK